MNNPITELLNLDSADPIPPLPTEGEANAATQLAIEARERGTDLDAALRFARRFSNMLRYCPGLGWLYWDGRRWAIDNEGRALELAKGSARQWTQQCARLRNDRDKMLRLALTLEGTSHIKGAVELAKTDRRLVLPHTALDQDPWLLNVLNGTLNLHTGSLRPHSRADFITKLAPVTYVPGARHEILDHYLSMVEAHTPGMTAFLARSFGAGITGDASAESLFLLQGDGGSGKTTIVEAVASFLGDYAVKLPFESFCTSKHGRSPGAASPDLITLRGARLAYASEGDQSARLDAGIIKLLTGNEPLTARGLYSSPITFPQSWKVWMVSNFEPKVDGDDTGIWRRMIKLPFSVIPVEQRDPRIKHALNNDPMAQSALLAWTVSGCLDWQAKGGGRIGLASPAAVEAATAEYRARQDTMSEWWDDVMVESALVSSGFTSGAKLRANYEGWCKENGASPVFNHRFNRYLESKGLRSGREYVDNGAGGRKLVRGWFGLRFGPPPPPEQIEVPY